jgi:predicted flap endonuclease-1-like 5' DNA nuclease
MATLRALKGIGPKSQRCLNEIGIYTREQLEAIGPIDALIKLKQQCSITPSLNFLYSMVGALEDKHWTDLTKLEKGLLLFQLEGYQEIERTNAPNPDENKAGFGKDISDEFQTIPGVGKSLSKNFIALGYRKVHDLRGESPETMYQNLIQLRGHPVDRCVLYVFRCAVYYANNSLHDPELLKWWSWKDRK